MTTATAGVRPPASRVGRRCRPPRGVGIRPGGSRGHSRASRSRGPRTRQDRVDPGALLLACARAGDPEVALDVLRRMTASGARPSPEDHALVLAAYALAGRGEEAEAYLRSRIQAGDPVSSDHYALVIRGYGYGRRPHDAERLYRELEASSLTVQDAARVALLSALALNGCADDAARWYERFAASGVVPSPEVFARAIDAQSGAAGPEDVRRLRAFTPEATRSHPEVADAFVHAFADAGDAEGAERCLVEAIEVVRDPDVREAMVSRCLDAYRRQGRQDDVGRLVAWARERGLALWATALDEPE